MSVRGPAESIPEEHARLHAELQAATQAGGETAEAATAVMNVLFPHLLLEAEFAIPPLALIPALARGEFEPSMSAILRKTDTLETVLPRMLEEHDLIVDGLRRLLQAASREQHPGYAAFAQRLIRHAQLEEEVLYPAALLVGRYVRLLAEKKKDPTGSA